MTHQRLEIANTLMVNPPSVYIPSRNWSARLSVYRFVIGPPVGLRVPVVGVVYHPVSGDMYTACQGQGAFLNGAQIEVSRGSVIAGYSSGIYSAGMWQPETTAS